MKDILARTHRRVAAVAIGWILAVGCQEAAFTEKSRVGGDAQSADAVAAKDAAGKEGWKDRDGDGIADDPNGPASGGGDNGIADNGPSGHKDKDPAGAGANDNPSTTGDKGDPKEDALAKKKDEAADPEAKDPTKKPGDGEKPDPEATDPKPKPPVKMTREKTYNASVTDKAAVTSKLDVPYVDQEIALKRTYYDKAKQVKQIVRPVVTDTYAQGYKGNDMNETFDQIAGRLLDILIVVDNSGSMEEEQNNLATKLLPLLKSVGASDWQIGVVTTDTDKACLVDLIKKGDANVDEKFKKAVTQGTGGNNNERGILAAHQSLTGKYYDGSVCLSKPWIRDMSTIAVLIVSDEDNCSDGKGCPNKPYANGSYLYDYLAAIRVPKSTARVYGLIWHASQEKNQCSTAYNKANIYSKLIDDTAGTWGSICDSDYTPTLEAMSKNIRVTLNSKFTLSYVPDPGTLKVYWGSQEVTTGFTMNGKVVDFALAPPDGTKVSFAYKLGSQPIKTSFKLSMKPLADRVLVQVNDQLVDPTTYKVNVAVPEIEFLNPPAEKAKIGITFTQDVALTALFRMGGDVVRAGTMKVFVNDVETAAVTVNDTLGTVMFGDAPGEGAKIDFKYTQVGPGILRYPLATKYEPPKGLMAFDSNSKAPIAVRYDSGYIELTQADFIENRAVTVRYENEARQMFTVELGQVPLTGSVSAIGGNVMCSKSLRVADKTVYIEGCNFGADVNEVKVSYEYVVASYQEFTFDADNLPGAADYQDWRVYVNDVETTDFSRAANVITFAKALPAKATIKVRLTQIEKKMNFAEN